MTAFTKLTVTEIKLLVREPLAMFFSVLFPSILIAILGAVKSFREPAEALGGLRVIDVYVGIAVILSLAMLALQVVPGALTSYREKGILRRLATTPVPPVLLLGAQLVAALLTAIASVGLVLALGRIMYAVPLPAHLPAFVLAFVLAAVGIFAVGLFLSAVVPTSKAATGAGTLLFFPMMFFAGLWTPREIMPGVLRRVSDFMPLGAGERALHEAMTGHWPNLLSVTVLLGYLVVFGAAAARLFRWS